MKMFRGVVLIGVALAGLGLTPPIWRSWQSSSQLQRVRANITLWEPSKVLDQLQPFEERASNSAEVSYLLGVANRRAGHTAKARDYFADARRLGWSARDLKREDHLLQFQSGDTGKVEQYLLGVAGANCADEEAAEIYECIVMGYLSAMRLNDAKVCLEYWLAWRPDSIIAHLLRAEILRATHDRVREVTAYEAVLKVDPEHVRARKLLADAYLDVKDITAALSNYERCLALAPDDASILASVAACQRRLGKFSEARELLDRALAHPSTDVARSYALTELAQLALNDKQYQRAVELGREAAALVPVNASAHYALGLALARVGEQKEADWHVERSQEIDADITKYHDLVSEVMRSPENADLRLKAGDMALKDGARKVAFAWFQSALRCDPSHIETHQALARYYAEGGHNDLATRHLAQANGEAGSSSAATEAVH